MLQLLQHPQIDKLKWNTAVNRSLTPFPYLYSWYLDIVSPGWLAIADNDYDNLLPVAVKKKAGIRYLYQPFFTQQFGLIQKENDSAIISEAIKLIQKNFSYAELQFNFQNKPEEGNKLIQRQTHHLNLNQPYQLIEKGYHTNLKRKLKKKISFNIIETDDAKLLIDVFKMMKGNEVSVLKEKDYNTLKQLIDTSCKKKSGIVKLLYTGNEFLAGTFLLMNEYYIINLFPVSSEEGRLNNGMAFLLDAIIKEHAFTNKIFDFEGSDIQSIARFYKSFGAIPIAYQKIILNNLPWHSRLIKNIKDGLQSRR